MASGSGSNEEVHFDVGARQLFVEKLTTRPYPGFATGFTVT